MSLSTSSIAGCATTATNILVPTELNEKSAADSSKINAASKEALLKKVTESSNTLSQKEITLQSPEYPNVLRDMIYRYLSETAKIYDVIDIIPGMKSTDTIMTAITATTAIIATSILGDPAKKEQIVESNKMHDLELQLWLILKEHPEQRTFVETMEDQEISLEEQVLLLRKGIYLSQSPEYAPAVDAWQTQNISLEHQVTRLQLLREYAFGTNKWAKYFGTLDGKVPELPTNIFEILIKSDTITPEKTVMDTHVLVLVPKAVNIDGKSTEISLQTLGELVKQPKNGGMKTGYAGCYCVDHETDPHWVLMRKEVLPESIEKWYEVQKDVVEKEYSMKAGVPHFLPNTLDAAVCCFLTYISTGVRLFEAIYIYCQDTAHPLESALAIVGNFSDEGLNVDRDLPGRVCGAAPSRKL